MAAQPTIFSRIIAGEIPADIIYRDEWCVALRDIAPQAPVHVLIVPIEPIETVAAAETGHEHLLGHLLVVAAQLGASLGVADSGYRLIINHGADGGQTVPHLHIHLLAGRPLGALVGGGDSH